MFGTVKDLSDVDFVVLKLYSDIDSVQFYVNDGCPSYLLPKTKADKTSYYKSAVYFIASRLLAERPIVAHLNYASQLPFAKIAKDVLRANILYTQHYMDWSINFGDEKEMLNKELENIESDITRKFNNEKHMMGTCASMIVTANHSYDSLKDKYRIDCSKVLIIPHTVSFTKSNVDVATLRAKYNLAQYDRILLYVGRLYDNKNILSLLKVFANINIPNVYLCIVGDGHFNLYLNEINISDWEKSLFGDTGLHL